MDAYGLDFWLNAVVILGLSILGIIGNLVCIMVLYSSNTKYCGSLANLLRFSLLTDSLFLLVALPCFSLSHISPEYKASIYPQLVPFCFPLLSILYTGSMYSVVAITIQKYFHLKYKNYTQNQGCGRFLAPVVAFSVCYNVPRFFEFATKSVHGRIELYQTEMMKSSEYRVYLLITNLIFTGVLPFAGLLVIGVLTSRELSRSESQCSSRCAMSVGLLRIRTAIVLAGHSLRNAINVYELILRLQSGLPPLDRAFVDLSHVFLVLAASTSIIVFIAQDPDFRRVLLYKVLRISKSRALDHNGVSQHREGLTVQAAESELRQKLVEFNNASREP